MFWNNVKYFLRPCSSRNFFRSYSLSLGSFENGNAFKISIQSPIRQLGTLNQISNHERSVSKLLELRKLMARNDLFCYIIPSEDEHQSEYVVKSDERRAFISEFTGSAGIACVTNDLVNFSDENPNGKAILSTDGRYFTQAESQLDFKTWKLLRQGEDELNWKDWCINEAKLMSLALGGTKVKIGIDPKLITYKEIKDFEKLISKNELKTQIELVEVKQNLIDTIWNKFETAPNRKLNPIYSLPEEFSGKSYQKKRDALIKKLKESTNGQFKFLTPALDEIAWLLNLRGSDIDYNPFFFSYLLLDDTHSILFTDNPIPDDVNTLLEKNEVSVKPYNEIWKYIVNEAKKMIATNQNDKVTFLLPETVSWRIVNEIKDIVNCKFIESPIQGLKSIKNEREIENAMIAQKIEAVCLAKYFSWLEKVLKNNNPRKIT
ncbi:hypothetical protein Kpol_1044p19, partial [Vanderwaltozyma polyspora DSM 70294]